jgi:ribosome-associated toxin RatA of RatAB toxin-antitoxin module
MGRFHKIYSAKCTPEEAFLLINDTECYAQILPYCHQSGTISHESPTSKLAYLVLGHGGMSVKLVTRNEYHAPKSIQVQLVEGPMEALNGSWCFESSLDGCLITVEFQYQFTNWLMQKAFESVFSKMVDDVLSRFSSIVE